MKRSLALLFLLIHLCGYAQYNSDYIQYMFNGLLVNPAYAGSQEAMNITALYRKQWVGLTGAPGNAMLTLHAPLKNNRFNLGAILTNDRYGVYNNTNASLVYAYRFPFLKGKLSFGLQGGIIANTTNWDKISTSDAGDPNFTPDATRAIQPAFGAGAYYHSNSFYLGISAPALFNGQINPAVTSMLTAGALIKAGDVLRIKPALLVKHIAASPLLVNISSTFYYKEVAGLGLGYTYNNSIMAYMDIKLNEQFNFGYGYSYMMNALNSYTSGSHELMLRYLFRYKIKAVNARYF